MKYVTTHFEMPSLGDYARLFRVFEHSVKVNSPGCEVVKLEVKSPSVKRTMTESLEANHAKMMAWVEYIDSVDDDVVLIDCDMMVMKDFREVFAAHDFDIGLTEREHSRIPINGGVVMVRNTPAAKAFMRLWARCDTELYNDHRQHVRWRQKYRGMNQASLGYLLETKPHGARVQRFPCRKYNSCDNTWKTVETDKPYAIHCKANMKRLVLSKTPLKEVRHQYLPVAKIWREYETQCTASA